MPFYGFKYSIFAWLKILYDKSFIITIIIYSTFYVTIPIS